MIEIKLMPDYQCWPLWSTNAIFNGAYNINPSILPISELLKKELDDWREEFDSILNMNDPASSDFPSDAAFELFKKKGRDIKNLLQSELGLKYKIIYYYDIEEE